MGLDFAELSLLQILETCISWFVQHMHTQHTQQQANEELGSVTTRIEKVNAKP